MFETTAEIEALCTRLATYRMTPLELSHLLELHEALQGLCRAEATSTPTTTSIASSTRPSTPRPTMPSWRSRRSPSGSASGRSDGRSCGKAAASRGSREEHDGILTAIAQGNGEEAGPAHARPHAQRRERAWAVHPSARGVEAAPSRAPDGLVTSSQLIAEFRDEERHERGIRLPPRPKSPRQSAHRVRRVACNHAYDGSPCSRLLRFCSSANWPARASPAGSACPLPGPVIGLVLMAVGLLIAQRCTLSEPRYRGYRRSAEPPPASWGTCRCSSCRPASASCSRPGRSPPTGSRSRRR